MKLTTFITKISIVLLLIIGLFLIFPVKQVEAVVPEDSNITKKAEKTANPLNSLGPKILPGDEVKVEIKITGDAQATRDAADIVLVMDVSGSMTLPWCVKFDGALCVISETRIASAKRAMIAFVQNSTEDKPGTKGDYVGLVTYSSWDCAPECGRVRFGIANMNALNKQALIDVINSLTVGGGTPIGSGLDMANQELLNLNSNIPTSTARTGVNKVPKYIVMATDGYQNVAPSPYQASTTSAPASILQFTKNNNIALFTVGIGDDVQAQVALAGCIGCPTNSDGLTTSGELVMKDMACFTDSIDSDPLKRCNLAQKDSDTATNDITSPRNYFYAPSADELTLIYTRMINRLLGSLWYVIYDQVNTQIFKSNMNNVKVLNCKSPYNIWPTKNTYVGTDIFIMTVEAIKNLDEVCITFNVNVLDNNAVVTDTSDVNGINGNTDIMILGDLLRQQLPGKTFNIDDLYARNSSVWPENLSCPLPGGVSTGLVKCLTMTNGVPDPQEQLWYPGWVDVGKTIPLGGMEVAAPDPADLSVSFDNTSWLDSGGNNPWTPLTLNFEPKETISVKVKVELVTGSRSPATDLYVYYSKNLFVGQVPNCGASPQKPATVVPGDGATPPKPQIYSVSARTTASPMVTIPVSITVDSGGGTLSAYVVPRCEFDSSPWNNNEVSVAYAVVTEGFIETQGGDVGAVRDIRMAVKSKNLTPSIYQGDYVINANTMNPNVDSKNNWIMKNYTARQVPSGGLYEYFDTKFKGKAESNCSFSHSAPIRACGGNLTFNSVNAPAPTGTVVLFVEGDLRLEQNFVLDANTSVLFVVKGNVIVNLGVNRIDGVFIVKGTFSDSDVVPAGVADASGALTVNGSVFAANGVSLKRYFTTPINKTTPANKFIWSPKFLLQLSALVGTSSIAWKEVAP